MDDTTTISVIIPCYKSEQFLEKTYSEVKSAMEDLNVKYEIILINDSSPDGTFNVIKKLSQDDDTVLGIDLAKNFGQHSALMAGMTYASGQYIVCMDDDGQTPADEIYKLIGSLNEDTDVVFAEYEKKEHKLYRNLGSKANSKMSEWLIGKPKKLYISSFFACKRYVIEEMLKYNNAFPYVTGLILRTTNKISNIKVNHKERKEGKSGYSMKKLFGLWLNGFTAFSVKPLRIAIMLGVLTSLCGFAYMLYLIISRLIIGYSTVEGWYSLISVVLFIGGLIMIVIGMVGEYVGRIYISLNNAPQFVIREKTFKK